MHVKASLHWILIGREVARDLTQPIQFQCKRQYMSAIFYTDEEQKTLAEESLKEMKAKATSKPITTLVLAAEKFFVAEE